MGTGSTSLGALLVGIGIGVVVLGVLIWGMERLGVRLGQLPLDFHFKGKRGDVYLPLGSSILASVVLTLLANWLLRR